jgi:integrase
VRLHDLRHGAGSLALAVHGDMKIVQDMLGHASYAYTADTYTNSRELHQVGEKSLVARSGRRLIGLSRACGAAA